jgi:hypothetical protein
MAVEMVPKEQLLEQRLDELEKKVDDGSRPSISTSRLLRLMRLQVLASWPMRLEVRLRSRSVNQRVSIRGFREPVAVNK